MLTRELLNYSIRKGIVYPRFVNTQEPELCRLAEDLVDMANKSVGHSWQEVQEALDIRTKGYHKQKVSRGLMKLVLDRLEVEKPGQEPWDFRKQVFTSAMQVLENSSENLSLEDYRAKVSEQIQKQAAELEHDLYSDLEARRAVAEFLPITATKLLDRYNLALAQGLLFFSKAISLHVDNLEQTEIRRVLGWMRFCRLLTSIEPQDEGYVLKIEGPASIFDGSKSYGMQLAIFLGAVPLLKRYFVSAQLELPTKKKGLLQLSHEDPLTSSLPGGAGYIPDEIKSVIEKVEVDGWCSDVSPAPKIVGVNGIAVPDISFKRESDGLEIVIELFHRWHKGLLQRRIQQLTERPDEQYFIGVDRSLAKDDTLKKQFAEDSRVFTFGGFPSVRTLKSLLKAQAETK